MDLDMDVDQAAATLEVWKCETCAKSFTKKRSLTRHLDEKKRHQDGNEHLERRYKCLLCPKTCARSYDLRQHVQSQHTPTPTFIPRYRVELLDERSYEDWDPLSEQQMFEHVLSDLTRPEDGPYAFQRKYNASEHYQDQRSTYIRQLLDPCIAHMNSDDKFFADRFDLHSSLVGCTEYVRSMGESQQIDIRVHPSNSAEDWVRLRDEVIDLPCGYCHNPFEANHDQLPTVPVPTATIVAHKSPREIHRRDRRNVTALPTIVPV